jgi:hypothetical protein
MDGHIAHDQGTLAPGDDRQTHVARGMAWRGDGRDLPGQGLFPGDELEDAQGRQGAQGFLPIGKGHRPLHLWPLKGLPVGLVHHIARLGEGGARRCPVAQQVPAHMVGMQVRKEHGRHVLRTHPHSLQLRQQPAIDPSCEGGDHPRIRSMAPNAGIDQDCAALRAQHVAAIMVAPGLRAGEEGRVALLERRPCFCGHGGKELTQGEGELPFAIGEGQDLHIAYEECAFCHRCILPRGEWGIANVLYHRGTHDGYARRLAWAGILLVCALDFPWSPSPTASVAQCRMNSRVTIARGSTI